MEHLTSVPRSRKSHDVQITVAGACSFTIPGITMRTMTFIAFTFLCFSILGFAGDIPPASPASSRQFPALRPVPADSLVDVIVEFVEPPLLLQPRMGAPMAAPLYFNRFSQFQADLGHRATVTSASGASHRYYNVFFGTALSLTERDIAAAEHLPYVKRVHRARHFTGHMERSLSQMHVQQAWGAYGVKGDGILVAIIDSGIDYLHPALGGGLGASFKVIGGFDLVNGDPDPMDDNGHGTHVAGIVAANSATIQGVAPLAKLLAYKVLNSAGKGREADILAALERVADPNQDGDSSDRPDIVNMSLGSDAGDPDDALSTAVDNIVRLGITVCVSAGNAGRFSPVQGKEDNYYYTSMESVGSPGSARLAITVGAVDSLDARPEYSSKGPAAGTFAIKPDVLAPGDMVLSLAPGGGTTVKSGTSMASPMAAGIAALLKSRSKTFSPEEIKATLMNSARDLGLPVMEQGAGRIDALRALDLTTLALPASLDFGLDDPSLSVWTTTDTVLVENHDDALHAYVLAATGSGMGVTLTATPSSFTLAAHAAQQVVIRLTVNNAAVPIVDEDIRLRDGMVIIQGTKDTIGIPWAFARTSRLFMDFGAPVVSFFGAGPNFSIVPATVKFGPKVHWLDKSRVQIAGVNPDTYDLLVTYAANRALVVREQVPFHSEASITFSPAEAVHTVRLDGRDSDGAPFPLTGMTRRTLVATLPSAYAIYAHFPEGSAVLPVSAASGRIRFQPLESYFDWRNGGRAVLPQYPGFSGISGDRTLIPAGSGYVHQHLSFAVPPGTHQAKLYADVIGVDVVNDKEFFNTVQIAYDTVDVSGNEIHMDLAIMSSSDPLHYASLAFHVNAGDLSTDVLDYSTRYLTVSHDSVLASLYTQRSPVVDAFPNHGTMRFGRGPVHILSQSYNNIAGTCIQFMPNFRGGLIEDRFHDGRRGSYTVYNSTWQPVRSGALATPREPLPMPAGPAHLLITADNFHVRSARGAVTLVNTVDLAHQVPDPPYITSFAVLGSDLLPTDSAGWNNTATLRFSSRPPLPGTLPVADSTRAYYRRHGERDWLTLPVTVASVSGSGVGMVFTSPLAACTVKDSVGIDLRIRVVDAQGHASDMIVAPAFAVGAWDGNSPTDINDPPAVPVAFALEQNFPNPFNPATVIRYAVGGSGTPVLTRLHVFDVLGRKVAALVDEPQAPGDHEVRFDATPLASGVYFYRLVAGENTATRKMILMR
jgi:subtilisin family serine protease